MGSNLVHRVSIQILRPVIQPRRACDASAPPPHFRTIQICLNDLPAEVWQAVRADGGHSQAGGRLMSEMGRREFTALVGSTGLLLTAKLRRARAQQSDQIRRIGVLTVFPCRSPADSSVQNNSGLPQ